MEHWTLLELFTELHADKLRQQASQPTPPARPRLWTRWRQRLARGLVSLGLRLDGDVSRAVIGSMKPNARLNGSDA